VRNLFAVHVVCRKAAELILMKVHDLHGFVTYRLPEGIIRTEAKPGIDIVLGFAIENSLVVNELCRGRKHPLLIDLKHLKSITPQARAYFSARDRETDICAFAFLIHSAFQRMVGNIFIQFNNPPLPTRLFNGEEAALAWLRTHMPPAKGS
jgi:hypothetical protein